jgi:hypothetical protein
MTYISNDYEIFNWAARGPGRWSKDRMTMIARPICDGRNERNVLIDPESMVAVFEYFQHVGLCETERNHAGGYRLVVSLFDVFQSPLVHEVDSPDSSSRPDLDIIPRFQPPFGAVQVIDMIPVSSRNVRSRPGSRLESWLISIYRLSINALS